jgi:hypothetical protein
MSLWSLRYRHGNATVEAFRWAGDDIQCEEPQWVADALALGRMRIEGSGPGTQLLVSTPAGWAVAKSGDWIVRRTLQMEVCSDVEFRKRCAPISRLINRAR